MTLFPQFSDVKDEELKTLVDNSMSSKVIQLVIMQNFFGWRISSLVMKCERQIESLTEIKPMTSETPSLKFTIFFHLLHSA